MRRTIISLLFLALTAFPALAEKVRVGVYDSRLVALAYYNTPEHRAFAGTIRNAKIGAATQELMHYQVFGVNPIPNVIEKLKDRLPAIAQEANVVVIVSKWEVVHASADVEYVDVTDRLVAEFKPEAKVQKWIDEARKKDPLPLLTVMTEGDH